MSTITGKKNIVPFIAALIVFMVFSCIYFYPLLQGKIMLQSDIVNFVGTSKEAADYYNANGKPALWTNSMFSGMPTYQVMLPGNGNIFEQVNKYMGLMLPRPANYMFIALIAFFVLLRSFRVNYFLSISGALCYALGTYLITFMEAGHNTKVNALALLPFILAGINYLFKNKFWLGATLTLFGLTCQITANHPQITYYTFLIIGCWMISEFVFAIREKKYARFFKITGIIALSVLFAVSANTSRLWTTYEYSKETIRGGHILTNNDKKQETGLDRDYAFAWSSGIAESFSIMYPNFAGGGSGASFLQDKKGEMQEGPILSYLQGANQQSPQKVQELMQVSGNATKYWGDMPFTSGPIYVGSILCFLFLLGAFLADNRTRWWLIAATILSLFLGWGKNFPAFNNFMFAHFPLYDKFRTVSMAMTILCLTIPLFAYYITDRFLSQNNEIDDHKKLYALKWSTIIVGGISILLLLSSSFFNLLSPAESDYLTKVHDPQSVAYFGLLKDARAGMIRNDVIVTCIFIALSAGALFLFLKKTISRNIALAIICILPVLDLLIVDSNYLGSDNYVDANYFEQRFRQYNPVIKDSDPDFRVYNTRVAPDKDGSTSYYYKSLGGYHGAKLQRYQDLIDGHLNKGNLSVINMLNTKYFISDRGKQLSVIPNRAACGNAWFVDTIAMVKNANEEFASLNNFNPLTKAFVHDEFKAMIPLTTVALDSTAHISLTKYSPDEMTYSSSSNTDAAAIFSEIWYRGNQDWKAYIDGKYVDHFRANYVLRGLWIPKGNHEITFKFEPNAFYSGKKISTAASGIILIIVLIGFFFSYREENKKNPLQQND